jgi:hypothetical protein
MILGIDPLLVNFFNIGLYILHLKTVRWNQQSTGTSVSDVNLKTGQIMDDSMLPWSLQSTLLLYG